MVAAPPKLHEETNRGIRVSARLQVYTDRRRVEERPCLDQDCSGGLLLSAPSQDLAIDHDRGRGTSAIGRLRLNILTATNWGMADAAILPGRKVRLPILRFR